MRRVLCVCSALVALCLVLVPAASGATPPPPTITSPAEGAYLTGADPSFTGTGAANGDGITVNLYGGGTATGLPLHVYNAQVANGTWTVAPPGDLPDGTYTLQVVENDAATASQGTSQAITFTLFSSMPGLTLSLPGTTVSTPAPTFSGTAPTGSADGTTVIITVYAGTSTNATPLAQFSGPLPSSGTFSITASPGLGNGTYTAVASQAVNGSGTDFSPTLTFTVDATAPALTLTTPAAGGSESQTSVVFGGAAGNDYGDDQSIHLTLYSGASTAGKVVGTKTVTPSAGAWQYSWPTRLALGTYTLVATQSNIIGQTTTVVHTFTVAPPGVLQGIPTITRTGQVRVRVACPGSAPTCTGDVLVVTQSKLRPISGGPTGILRLLFRHYSVNGGASALLTAQLGRAQLDALKRAGGQKLTVTTVYALGAKLAETRTTTKAVKVSTR